MPPRNERVIAMVRSELGKNPSVGNDVLMQKAVDIDRNIRRLSARQFHATYRLPIVRSSGGAGGAAKAASKSAAKAAPAKGASAPASQSAPSQSTPAQPSASAVKTAPSGGAGGAGGTASAAPPEAPRRGRPPRAASGGAARGASSVGGAGASRESVRRILSDIAHQGMAAEDRASFMRLNQAIDEGADAIMGLFGRA